jgi:hypothetical protein
MVPHLGADHPEIQPEVTYADRFKNGYGYNIYFSFTSSYPQPGCDAARSRDCRPLDSRLRNCALRQVLQEVGTERPCQPPARRRFQPLDSRLGLTNAKGDLKGQHPYANIALAHADTPGGLNIRPLPPWEVLKH